MSTNKVSGELSKIKSQIREEDERGSSSEKPQKLVRFNLEATNKVVNLDRFDDIEELSEPSTNKQDLAKVSKQMVK